MKQSKRPTQPQQGSPDVFKAVREGAADVARAREARRRLEALAEEWDQLADRDERIAKSEHHPKISLLAFARAQRACAFELRQLLHDLGRLL